MIETVFKSIKCDRDRTMIYTQELATCDEADFSSSGLKSGNDKESDVVELGNFDEMQVARREESRPPLRKIQA